MLIRDEKSSDYDAVFELNVAAFDTPAEAGLVDRLRRECDDFISLVAVDEETVVGHIFFSPVTLAGHRDIRIVGLAPMAVAPAMQRQGIGSALVRAGLNRCRASGVEAVIVLGHPDFYPRFGFVPASRFGIECEFPAPDAAFMALECEPDALRGKLGRIEFHVAFHDM